jgi:hypothetical protein
MRNPSDAVRDHLVRALEWEDAHVAFDKAVADLPPNARGVRPPGYVHDRRWPDDYWPPEPAPPSEQAWAGSLAAYVADRERLKRLAREADDFTALVPTGTGSQTYLRALLLALDHAAYHVGQIVAVRRALGVWQ